MQDHDTTTDQTAPESMGRRAGELYFLAGGDYVHALTLAPEDDWHVSIEFGRPGTGAFLRYLTVQQAREMADALVSAADHYDAETARLAEFGGAA